MNLPRHLPITSRKGFFFPTILLIVFVFLGWFGREVNIMRLESWSNWTSHRKLMHIELLHALDKIENQPNGDSIDSHTLANGKLTINKSGDSWIVSDSGTLFTYRKRDSNYSLNGIQKR